MEIHVTRNAGMLFERLEDGASIVFDPVADAAHALNPSATRVWEALIEGGDKTNVRSVLTESLGPAATEDAVYNTLAQFQAAGLIRTSRDDLLATHSSRREALRRLSLGFAAIMGFPLIETLTGTQQRALAQAAKSIPTKQTPPP